MQFSNNRMYGNSPMATYQNAMDPQMYEEGLPKEHPPFTPPSVRDVGMSVPMGISAQNVAGIYSKIRMGVGSIEIGFPAKYQGGRGAMTAGQFGEDQRQAIREIAKLNEVKLTTHSAYNIMGMMGRDERGNFSIESATQDLSEIKSAIDFAADTAGGGSVVVHTGEWERPMTDMVIDDETGGKKRNLGWDLEGTKRNMFRQHPREVFDAQFKLIDDRDSRIYEQVSKSRTVNYPVWLRADSDKDGMDQDGNPVRIKGKKYDEEGNLVFGGDYLDYEGRKIKDENVYEPVKGRVPVYDNKERRFKVEKKDFYYFQEEAIEYNEWLKKNYKTKYGKEWYEDKEFFYNKVYPEEMYLRATLESDEGYSRGYALQFTQRIKENLEFLGKLRKAREFYADLVAKTPVEDRWKIARQDDNFARITGGIIPPETKDPVDVIDKQIRDLEASLEYERLAGYTQEGRARDTAETKQHLITPIKRFEKVATQLYAMAAIHAMRRSKDPGNPITLTVENIFPDRFGCHPQELKWVIGKIREKMVEMLTEDQILYGEQQGYPTTSDEGRRGKNPYKIEGISKEEARKIAETHVKATFDTAHMNLWRKYWVEIPGKGPEENESEFKKWYLQQFEDLLKNKMIGNMHLVDNLGYWDDHLAPGQGNAPIKEVMGLLKKYGYDKAITTEPGADASADLSDFHGLMKTWRYLGSPIYGAGFGAPRAPQTWTGVMYSYFGQVEPPQYTFGAYAPSNDWTLWSQVPLE
ncbi:sugar phosphate isomerase/epimerase [Candidatus Woesearchaeota archaeon]|nr:sugar phosphate isomerase/epimerase [Candidatus Woesearchaeota archaeon]